MAEDWLKSLDTEEKSQFFSDLKKKSKEKQTGADRDDEDEKKVFAMMCGEPQNVAGNPSPYYDNLYLPAWKAFAPKYASKTPCPSARALIGDRVKLAEAFQALFRYRISTFNYRALVSAAAMDVWASKLGIGYVRHHWDEQKGLTTTSRIGPRDVFWDYTASSTGKAGHVIERHVLKRGEFIKKFGAKKGWDVEPMKDGAVDWPRDKRTHEGKTLFDQIEYFLMWSKEGGRKRVYAFTEKKDDGILNGADGEEWPIVLCEDDWHLTDLRLTKIPGRINGISPIWAADGQHTAYQNINRAVYYSNLKAGKGIGFFPEDLLPLVEKIEEATRTFNFVPYSPEDLNGQKLEEAIAKWEMPITPETLLLARTEAQNKWRGTINLNAATMMEAQNLETATEAQTMQTSAANLVADDQGAVEEFTTEIFRKEAACDASKMPVKSVVCWTPPDAKDVAEGEFADEPDDYAKKPEENLIPEVPYDDAVLLETGVASQAAAKVVAGVREKKEGEAEFQAVAGGAQPDEVEQAKQQATAAVPQTPEMAVRAKYGVPMDAECRIVNPGVEQFIGPVLAEGWVEGLTPRQIQSELGISIEPGSSSPTQRMQAVNEVLMLYNAVSPVLLQLGMYEALAELINAAFKKSEISDLDNVEVSGQEIQQSVQQQQQQQAQAEAAKAAGQPQGQVPEDPNVMAKAKSEVEKAQIGHETQKEKTVQQQLKLEGDAARERTRSLSQRQMGGMPPQ